MGDVCLDLERLKEAYEVFQRAKSPIGLGRYYLKTGDDQKAIEMFAASLDRIETKKMPSAEILLADYIGLGLAYEALKDYPRSTLYFQKGIDLIEKQRGSLGAAERERFLEARVRDFPRTEPYNGMIRALIKEKGKDYQKNSLFFAERGKSRILLEMLTARSQKGKSETDIIILAKERGYQQDLLALRKRIEVLEGLGEKSSQGDLAQLKKELENKEVEFERFIKEVKLKNSELASLIRVSPTPVETIQSLLDRDTTLLEYYGTENNLYVWLLTRALLPTEWVKSC